MAAIGVEPVPNTPAAAKRALARDLPRVLKGRTLAEAGWHQPDDLSLLLPMWALGDEGVRDEYRLRLGFGYYPDWPPSAQFVNPDTAQYVHPVDVRHLPRIEGTPEIQVHANYDQTGRFGVSQLICASVTLEFYVIRHQVKPDHLWDPSKHNFAATINGIAHWLKPPYYKGRQR